MSDIPDAPPTISYGPAPFFKAPTRSGTASGEADYDETRAAIEYQTAHLDQFAAKLATRVRSGKHLLERVHDAPHPGTHRIDGGQLVGALRRVDGLQCGFFV